MSIVNIEAQKQNRCELWWSGHVSSANAPKAITPAGNATQILPFPGAGIGMFDGSGDRLQTTDISTDFQAIRTVEFWIYPISVTANSTAIFSNQYVDSTVGNGTIQYYNGVWRYFSTDGATRCSFGSPVLNTWSHMALVCDGTNSKAYVNGILVNTEVYDGVVFATIVKKICVGAYGADSGTWAGYFNGYLSEFRCSTTVRYTANFTPPRRQLESDSYTKLLLHFNRNDTTFIDSSPSAHAITAYGDAKQLCSPCGSGVAYFDGSGDYLSCGVAADWNLGTSVWTFDCWFIKINNTTSFIFHITHNSNYSYPLSIQLYESTNIMIYSYVNGTTTEGFNITSSSNVYSLSVWNHLRVTRKSDGYISVFINGTLIKTQSIGTSYVIHPAESGAQISYYAAAEGYLNGYVSELRFTMSEYTGGNFTPSTTPLKPDPYTKLLLHMDGIGAAFYDSSDPPGDNGFPILPDGVTITPTGTFAVQKMKDGRNIWYFDGSTNYISLSDLEKWTLGVYNFTVVLWARIDTVNAIHTLFHLFAATNSGLELYTDASAKLCLKVSDTSTAGNMINTTGSATLVASTWYHIAIVRSGSTFTVYLNLVSDSTGTSAASIINPTAIAIGCRPSGTPDQHHIGCIKDLQMFAGKALNLDQIAAIMDETYIY